MSHLYLFTLLCAFKLNHLNPFCNVFDASLRQKTSPIALGKYCNAPLCTVSGRAMSYVRLAMQVE